MAYRAHAAPAPVDECDAPAARAAPSPLVDGPVVQVVQVPQVVEKTIEIPKLQTIEKIVDIPEIQTVQSTQPLGSHPPFGASTLRGLVFAHHGRWAGRRGGGGLAQVKKKSP